MKHILTVFLILLLTTFSTKADKPTISNPVCLGIILIDEPTQEGMADICESYNLTQYPSEGGFLVYATPAGDKIRFQKLADKEPIVEIKAVKKFINPEKILTNSGYKKSDSTNGKKTYIRGYKTANRYKTCTILSPSNLLFSKSTYK